MESQKVIFLVDDASSNLKHGSDLLSKFYTVYTFDSGERMFKLIYKVRPDLVLLDIEMPEMDGYEVLEKIKADTILQDIPVIFLTAHNSDENELKGFEMGALDYITKPFSPPRLLKRIEVQLLMEKQRRELINYGHNLEEMVENVTADTINLKNVFVETMADLAEHRILSSGHLFRTQRYVGIILQTLLEKGIYAEEIRSIDIALAAQSSQLHDIGKITVSDSILSKPGPLTAAEFEEMKTHTSFGKAIIARIQSKVVDNGFLEYAEIFAESHHEKWDGNGYPHGLKGPEIPLLGRVMAIADVYDALVTKRPYKAAFSHETAVETIKASSGSHFDPALVEVFLSVHEQFRDVSKQEE
ncbi:MAG: response regulator [Defluviitaleaceae bacterium]|nr:response regulator [Defluviitaleaceae bacterium]